MSHWTETLFKEQAERYARFFEERFDAADGEADDLLALVAAEYDVDPETVLDLACGTGRHVIAFADRGLDAEGLDFSAEFLDRARDRARERGVAVRTTFRNRDLRDLDGLTGSYDLVTSFWNSLGYFDRETDERLLAEARRLLAADGVLAVELGNRDFYLANFEEASVREHGGGTGDTDDTEGAADSGGEGTELSVERRDYDVATGRFHTRLDLFDATDEGYEHDVAMEWENRMYAAPVLTEMCERAGFEDVRVFGGFDGRDLTLETDTLLLLAR